MKRFESGKRYKLDARELSAGGTRDRVFILDGHPIDKYGCRFDVEGVDFSEFERTGGQGFFGHRSDSDPPICEWKLWKEAGAVWGVPTFHSDLNPAAAVIEKLWNADKINAVSVGIEVVETIQNKDDELLTISKSKPYEVSIVNFGAHPHAGKGLSLTLSAAVADGTITDAEAGLVTLAGALVLDESEDTEGAALRNELETLRTENARLTAELAAKGTPAPEPAAVVELDNPKPDALTLDAAKQIVAEHRQHRAEAIAAAADRIFRRLTGKLPN